MRGYTFKKVQIWEDTLLRKHNLKRIQGATLSFLLDNFIAYLIWLVQENSDTLETLSLINFSRMSREWTSTVSRERKVFLNNTVMKSVFCHFKIHIYWALGDRPLRTSVTTAWSWALHFFRNSSRVPLLKSQIINCRVLVFNQANKQSLSLRFYRINTLL